MQRNAYLVIRNFMCGRTSSRASMAISSAPRPGQFPHLPAWPATPSNSARNSTMPPARPAKSPAPGRPAKSPARSERTVAPAVAAVAGTSVDALEAAQMHAEQEELVENLAKTLVEGLSGPTAVADDEKEDGDATEWGNKKTVAAAAASSATKVPAATLAPTAAKASTKAPTAKMASTAAKSSTPAKAAAASVPAAEPATTAAGALEPPPSGWTPLDWGLLSVFVLLLCILAGYLMPPSKGSAGSRKPTLPKAPWISAKAFDAENRLKHGSGFHGSALISFTKKSDCSLCQDFFPVLGEVSRLLSLQMTDELRVAQVNCDEHLELCESFGVSGDEPSAAGYPHLIWFRDGIEQEEKFDAERSVDGIIGWAEAKKATGDLVRA